MGLGVKMYCDRCGRNIDTDMWMLETFMFCSDCYIKGKIELGVDRK